MERVYAKYFPSYKSRPHLTIGTERKIQDTTIVIYLHLHLTVTFSLTSTHSFPAWMFLHWFHKKFIWIRKLRVKELWNSCPEILWNLLFWRYSKPTWTLSSATFWREAVLEGGGWSPEVYSDPCNSVAYKCRWSSPLLFLCRLLLHCFFARPTEKALHWAFSAWGLFLTDKNKSSRSPSLSHHASSRISWHNF